MATIAGCEDCVASACRRFVRLRSGFVRPLFVVSPCGRRRVCGGARGAEEVNEGMNQHQQHNASDCSDGNEAGSVSEMPMRRSGESMGGARGGVLLLRSGSPQTRVPGCWVEGAGGANADPRDLIRLG